MTSQHIGPLWKFSPIPNIEESNFNKILERFYNMRVTGLTRENTQNSMDGRLIGYEGPVTLTIKTGSIKKKDIPGIEDVIARIQSLQGRNSYTRETIQHMLNKLNQDEVRYISFEDSNTRGLTGARNGQSNSAQDTWGIYAYNKGVHFEEADSERETSRGGSHGVGKIASNAASDLHMMYFANCDEHGDQHLGGTVQLIEHQYEGKYYRSSGYFTDINEDQTRFYPYENTFKPVFAKDTRGLKIIIPFLRKEYDNENEIIKSICDSFFVSILKGKLEVNVNDEKLTSDTITSYVTNPDYYNQDVTEAKKIFTPLYVDTYLNQEPRELIVSDGERDFRFNLYFRYDEEIPKGRVAIVRTIGMKIEDFKVTANANKPYNAVMIGGSDEDSYIKSLENESHTELSWEHIKDAKLQKRAKRFINNLSREMAKVIEAAVKENNPTDGIMNTEDILYVVETQFKNDLSDSMGTVMINKGKSVVKASTSVPKKTKKNKNGKSGGEERPKRDPLKRKKTENMENDLNEELKTKYSANPEMVERVILNNKELIKFDFTTSEMINGETSCDISLAVIDGMGVEYPDEFNLQDNYSIVSDLQSGREYALDQNVIKDVRIHQGVSELQLGLKGSFNKSLKFVYYIEV
ncbi:hypothetical protein AF331_12550 [Rossellomorea marisflavi]|uniref:Uncharacterized protein n=1 Tax=Rossellomorea marisflavi TaxID=189381 RepID=A0A0M0G5X7_9BACI|nr:hypothetical protein [Rossellomorea marisflavi]KON84836.1 hypothetical protein AF331_12550 [Rossellomorea marisflavi]